MVVGRLLYLLSYWKGNFSGAMLNFGRVSQQFFARGQANPPPPVRQDVYYLLEIDPWGRRFYHRGGMRTGTEQK